MFRNGISALLAALAVQLAVLVSRPSCAASEFTQDASIFVFSLGTDAIPTITAPNVNDSDRDRESRFRVLFIKDFDIPAIGRFALGRYWRTATPAQQQEFIQLFENMVVRTYASKFKEYSGQKLRVTGAREEGEGRAIVSSEIGGPSATRPIRIDWRVAKGPDGNKIYDVIVEGVSMSVTEQQDFGSAIQRQGGGVDGLLAQLREKYGSGGALPTAEHGVAK